MKLLIKILAIDKEEIILKSIKRALNSNDKEDYLITTCDTALEGLKLIRSDAFDLILLDMFLPGISGNELLRRIRNTYPEIPIIIMSGYSPKGIYEYEKRISLSDSLNSATGYLLKPFTTEEIRSKIHGVLKSSLDS
jgi:CheY-like chemotaxis protein